MGELYLIQPLCLSVSYLKGRNSIGGVMVSVLASGAVDRGFELRSGQTKVYTIGKIGIVASREGRNIRRKSKDWLARNQDNVSEWGDIYIRGLLFQ